MSCTHPVTLKPGSLHTQHWRAEVPVVRENHCPVSDLIFLSGCCWQVRACEGLLVALVQKEDNTLDESLQPSDWAGPQPQARPSTPGLVLHRGNFLSVPSVLWSWAPNLIPGVPAQVSEVSDLPGQPLR